MDRRYVLWGADASRGEIEAALARGDAVEITLPQGVHHALYMHVAPQPSAAEGARVDAQGGVELLHALSTIAGLEELAALEEPVGRAGYSVVLQSPDPTLVLLPPEHHPLRISVECRRKHGGAPQPYEFRVGSRRLHVLRVVERTGSAMRERMTVLVADGRRFVLEHDVARGAWYMHGVLPPANAAPRAAP